MLSDHLRQDTGSIHNVQQSHSITHTAIHRKNLKKISGQETNKSSKNKSFYYYFLLEKHFLCVFSPAFPFPHPLTKTTVRCVFLFVCCCSQVNSPSNCCHCSLLSWKAKNERSPRKGCVKVLDEVWYILKLYWKRILSSSVLPTHFFNG